MEGDKNGNINGSLDELFPTLVDDFEGFKASVGEATANMVETAR